MTDDIHPEGQATETGPTSQEQESATAVETAEGGEGGEEQDKEKAKLRQDVEVRDAGPCRKHVRVSVNRDDIDARFKEHYSKLVKESVIRGFRPGKAPRRIVEKQFQKDVNDQVKNEVLMASLQQLDEDHKIAPLSEPEIDVAAIKIPEQGPLVYEFEVEVRPEFDLPNYRGLKLKRPIKDYTEADIDKTRRRYVLADYGQVVPKEEGGVELGDIIVADVTVRDGDRVINTLPENRYDVEKQLSFKDGVARRFLEQVRGAKAGDTRVVDIQMGSAAGGGMASKTLQATFHVRDVKTMLLPELTPEFLQESFGIHSKEDLDEVILVMLKRNLEHIQRRSAREQIVDQISSAAQIQVPEEMVKKQAQRALHRRMMEMRADGVPEAEIIKQMRLLQQNILETTAQSLREHFILQKIAEIEKIDVDEDDLSDEIERIAAQEGESARKVRARLEKEDMIEALGAEMVERKALDIILDSAEFEEVPLDEEEATPDVSTVEAQAAPAPAEEEQPTEATTPQS
jgi:trigger factor